MNKCNCKKELKTRIPRTRQKLLEPIICTYVSNNCFFIKQKEIREIPMFIVFTIIVARKSNGKWKLCLKMSYLEYIILNVLLNIKYKIKFFIKINPGWF